MQLLFFFSNFLTEKKVSVIVSQYLMNPEWEEDRRKYWGRARRPEADNSAGSRVSQPQNL